MAAQAREEEQQASSERDLRPLPPQTLAGRVVIVTGSSRGLGADMALDLARRGAKVVIVYTSPSSASKAASLVATIQGLPNAAISAAISVQADLSQESAPAAIVAATLAQFGPEIHILVNNAAVQVTRALGEITRADYERVYDVNVRGVVLLTQAVLPHMPARGAARVVNISSVGARAGFAGLSLYTSSKAALEGLTRAWAAELGANGTTVNCVAPGPVQSEMLDSIPRHIVRMQMDNTPLEHRVGTPAEVSSVVSWLAGPESGWVTGQVLNVSGGWTMY